MNNYGRLEQRIEVEPVTLISGWIWSKEQDWHTNLPTHMDVLNTTL